MNLARSFDAFKNFLKKAFENCNSRYTEDGLDANLYGSLSKCVTAEEAAQTLRDHDVSLTKLKQEGLVAKDYLLPVEMEDLHCKAWEDLRADFSRKHMSHVISSAIICTPH